MSKETLLSIFGNNLREILFFRKSIRQIVCVQLLLAHPVYCKCLLRYASLAKMLIISIILYKMEVFLIVIFTSLYGYAFYVSFTKTKIFFKLKKFLGSKIYEIFNKTTKIFCEI